MNERTLKAIARARQLVAAASESRLGSDVHVDTINFAVAVVELADALEDTTSLRSEVDRLVFALHRRRAHPDFEYATTETARKSGDDPLVGLDGDGWEPNEIVECHRYEDGQVVEERWCNWERYRFHEDNYYRRRKKP